MFVRCCSSSLFLRSFASPTRRTNEGWNGEDEPRLINHFVVQSLWLNDNVIDGVVQCVLSFLPSSFASFVPFTQPPPLSRFAIVSPLGETIVCVGGYVVHQRHCRQRRRQRRTSHCRIRMYLRIVHSYGTTLRAYQ